MMILKTSRALKVLCLGILLLIPLTVFCAQTYVGPPPNAFSLINCGGSISTGGTAQPLFTASQYKHGFIVEVGTNDSTDSLYFSDGPTTTTPGAGVAGSWSVAPSTTTIPGGSFSSPLNFPVAQAYFINGATTGDKYKCRVW
jgi:hypothetical protein